MSWSCRLVPAQSPAKAVGDMWFAWSLNGMDISDALSLEYERTWRDIRPPLMVRLPGPVDVCLDQRVDDEGEHGWCVQGTEPEITVFPSVNILGVYHGFIRNGIISPDCQGRQYHPDGTSLP